MSVTINGTNGITFNDSTNQATAGSSLFNSNGYQKLPSGLIIQWGKFTSTVSNSSTAVTFPIAFPNACLSVTGGTNGTSVNQYASSAFSITNTGCSITNNTAGTIITYIAIGY
jgi:hypothetical protein